MSAALVGASTLLRARSLSKWFGQGENRHLVLGEISLDIERGEIVSIIGRSGAGKSTLLRLLGGLIEPDTGQVLIDDVTVDVARANKTFGLMPQSSALFPWRNVEENVALPSQVNQKRGAQPMSPTEALRTVGLAERAKSMPSELSGGMRQRVAMARALATQAPILLLDEPFSALDEITRDSLYQQTLRIWNDKNHTVVLVTHNITEAVLLSDRVVVLAGTPSRVADIVDIAGDRPRQNAIDAGEYVDCIKRLRNTLETSGL